MNGGSLKCGECGKRVLRRMYAQHKVAHQQHWRDKYMSLLFLKDGAPDEVVRAVIRVLKARYHPDSNYDDARLFAAVCEAEEKLGS